MSKQRLVRVIAVLLFISLFLVAFNEVNSNLDAMKESILYDHTYQMDVDYHSIIDSYHNFTDMIFDLYINQPEVLDLFSAGLKAESPEKQNIYRKELYNYLLPMYQKLHLNNFRQLHFHDAASNSYLRFHRPETFGDSLVGIRDTVTYVNSEHLPVAAFEEGRIYNGYRFVYPLTKDGEHLGSVEVSIAISKILDLMITGEDDKNFFIIRKDTVENKVFDEELYNYNLWNVSDDFYVETESVNGEFDASLLSDEVVSDLEQLLADTPATETEELLFSLALEDGSILSVHGIENMHGDSSGYLLNVSGSTELNTIRTTKIVYHLTLSLSFLLLILIYMAVEMWTKRLNRKNKTLEELQHIGKMGSWELDLKKDRLSWSKEIYHIFGIEPKDFKATYEAFLEFVHPDDRKMVDETFQSALEHGESYTIRHRIIRHDGSLLYVDEICDFEYDTKGKLVRSLGTVRDVTDLVAYEKAITEKNNQLETAQKIARIGYYTFNVSDGSLSWSPEMYSFFGKDPRSYSPEYEDAFSLLHPDDREKVEKDLAEGMENKAAFETRYRIIREDGILLYIVGNTDFEYDTEGNVTAVVGTLHDITPIARYEQEIQDKNSILTQAQQVAKLGYWNYDFVQNKAEWSTDLFIMFGLDPETDEPSLATYLSVIHPDDLEEVKQLVENTNDSARITHRHRILKKDGSVLYVQAVVQIDLENGKPSRSVGTFLDITDIVEKENQLKRMRDKLESVVNKVPDIIYSCSKSHDRAITYVNDAVEQMTGYRANEFMEEGRTMLSIIHPDDQERITEEIERAVSANQVYRIDYRIITTEGETLYVQDIGQQNVNEEGELILEGSITDVSLHKDLTGRMRKFLDYQDNIVILSDGEQLLFGNRKFFHYTGFDDLGSFKEKHECICELFVEDEHVFHQNSQKEDESSWIESLQNLKESERIVAMKDLGGTQHTFAVTINAFDASMFLITFTDISENFSDKIRFRQDSLVDPLTGVHNRKFFSEHISGIIADYEAEGHAAGLIIIDIDNFKSINDTYGHDTGDVILKQLADILSHHIRGNDELIRWGGDEFVIIADTKNEEGLRLLAENLREQMHLADFAPLEKLTCSFGYAVHAGKNVEQTFKKADRALYQAKENGRDRVEGFHS